MEIMTFFLLVFTASGFDENAFLKPEDYVEDDQKLSTDYERVAQHEFSNRNG